jgi:hypothetical protein
MSRHLISRRQFLTLPLALALLPAAGARGEIARRQGQYQVDAGVLYGALHFDMTGTIQEEIDRSAGRYAVTLAGEGSGIANRVESTGVLSNGRWVPVRARSWFVVRGRESQSDIAYDHARGTIEYHFRGETFFWRRLRVADDVLTVPPGLRIDDVLSAALNYAEERWPAEGDGSRQTYVVRRRRNENEGPDDVEKAYRAELVPFVLRVVPDAGSGRSTAFIDMTRFSSWARSSDPARIVFGPNRRPESIVSLLMLGTSISIRIAQR